MTKREGRPPSQRQLRVGEELRHALAWIVERGELRDPALSGVSLTITEVRVSPDLKNATAFVTPLGGGDATAVHDVLDALRRAGPFLRHEAAKRMQLRYMPKFNFEPDTSFDEAGRIGALLSSPEVRRDVQAHTGDEDAIGTADDGEAGDDGA
ncbi:30S ribosome-binding factor RbfA [Varunaivibrio sulfuroxidans]|uniref:Ribosome-binding factor A n=1 Tax=Varunaivibrio sulfuroxidans TaxID=1773489 RepID=A0A4R3JJK4_9PROT|nr:30S ribosome-binding factor RbfA [Varunaivibrio sulfuroxidans]TCS65060.1 ribosome-binding factor A [Varunaivibrio sulfuroxidans]WES29653.1 30S ribosome-binding factor RbfA [Varunaivibrio sulfuroxidans]